MLQKSRLSNQPIRNFYTKSKIVWKLITPPRWVVSHELELFEGDVTSTSSQTISGTRRTNETMPTIKLLIGSLYISYY